MIDAENGNISIQHACKFVRVSRSGFYSYRNRSQCLREQANEILLQRIREIHTASRKTYGRIRVHAELCAQGVNYSEGRVGRLMRENGIRAKQKRRFKATTQSKHNYPVAPNILNREFKVSEPNQVWVADITYISTDEGWMYLATILDLYSRMLVGWSMDKNMTRQLTMDALTMAYWRRKPNSGLLHHSDRGSQYASHDYQKLLSSYGMSCSMSGKGECWDNAVMESFYHTLKTELTLEKRYETRTEAKAHIFEYIEVFYNRQRRHSFLGYATPVEFEQKVS